MQVERLAARMLRVQEKHREKLRQQAAQYRQAAGGRLTSQGSRNGSLAALTSIRARVEIVRCLKELHKSELRIEMCADDVVRFVPGLVGQGVQPRHLLAACMPSPTNRQSPARAAAAFSKLLWYFVTLSHCFYGAPLSMSWP